MRRKAQGATMAETSDWRRPTRQMLLGLPCLTLWRPWPTYIVHPDVPSPKRVENRTWHPPQRLVGQLLGIHAGSTMDRDVLGGTPAMIEHASVRGALVGVARLVGSVTECPPGQEHWWCGPVGWLLDDVVAFCEAVPMKGAQGVWTVDERRLSPHPDGCYTTDVLAMRDCESDGHYACAGCRRRVSPPDPQLSIFDEGDHG